MGNIRLNNVIRQTAFITPVRDDFWPIPDQHVGVEIELEGQSRKEMNAHEDRGAPFWAAHEDGSLREGIEYTLNQPLMGTALREAINYFFDNFTKFTASPRTSIHVHMNMRQDNETVEGLRNMVVLYYMYEDAFFQIADENRKWSSYCNAFEDNPPALLEAVVDPTMSIEALQLTLAQSARTNVNRYYGLNLNALSKYGTIEFRHFPLVDNRERLIDWLKLIMELKLAANTMAETGLSPWDVFQTPDDVVKLAEYMPQFGNLLLGHVDAGRAFTRMVNVRNLAIKKTRGGQRGIDTNPCFTRFFENQKKQGKANKPAGKKKAAKGITVDEIRGFNEGGNPETGVPFLAEEGFNETVARLAQAATAPTPPRPTWWTAEMERLHAEAQQATARIRDTATVRIEPAPRPRPTTLQWRTLNNPFDAPRAAFDNDDL